MPTTAVSSTQVRYGSLSVDGLSIAYREAGDPASPKLDLLHGFPSSSHQYRNLIPALASRSTSAAPGEICAGVCASTIGACATAIKNAAAAIIRTHRLFFISHDSSPTI